ncbi:unnamed protein product, partial [Ascophyllum nodosum]
ALLVDAALSAITRDGQFAGVPMTAEIHMKFGFLKVHVLDPTKSLKVFDIPPLERSSSTSPGRRSVSCRPRWCHQMRCTPWRKPRETSS